MPETFFNKGLWPATVEEKSPRHRCFPVDFVKFPKTPFLQNTSGRLVFYVVSKLTSTLNQRWQNDVSSKLKSHRSTSRCYFDLYQR